MKKSVYSVLVLLLSALFCLSTLGGVALAYTQASTSGVTISAANTECAVGKQATADFTVSKGSNLAAFQMTITYDATVITIDKVACPIEGASFTPNRSVSGEITVVCTMEENLTAAATLFSVTYTVIAGTANGTSIEWGLKENSAEYQSMNGGSLRTISGVGYALGKVRAGMTGDVNLDGVVDLKDLVYMQMKLAGLQDLSEEGKKNADINGDGSFSLADVQYVKMYSAEIIETLVGIAAESQGSGSTETKQYTVIFKSVKGVVYKTLTVKEGSVVLNLPKIDIDDEKEQFNGWYTVVDGVKVTFDETTKVTSALTVYSDITAVVSTDPEVKTVYQTYSGTAGSDNQYEATLKVNTDGTADLTVYQSAEDLKVEFSEKGEIIVDGIVVAWAYSNGKISSTQIVGATGTNANGTYRGYVMGQLVNAIKTDDGLKIGMVQSGAFNLVASEEQTVVYVNGVNYGIVLNVENATFAVLAQDITETHTITFHDATGAVINTLTVVAGAPLDIGNIDIVLPSGMAVSFWYYNDEAGNRIILEDKAYVFEDLDVYPSIGKVTETDTEITLGSYTSLEQLEGIEIGLEIKENNMARFFERADAEMLGIKIINGMATLPDGTQVYFYADGVCTNVPNETTEPAIENGKTYMLYTASATYTFAVSEDGIVSVVLEYNSGYYVVGGQFYIYGLDGIVFNLMPEQMAFVMTSVSTEDPNKDINYKSVAGSWSYNEDQFTFVNLYIGEDGWFNFNENVNDNELGTNSGRTLNGNLIVAEDGTLWFNVADGRSWSYDATGEGKDVEIEPYTIIGNIINGRLVFEQYMLTREGVTTVDFSEIAGDWNCVNNGDSVYASLSITSEGFFSYRCDEMSVDQTSTFNCSGWISRTEDGSYLFTIDSAFSNGESVKRDPAKVFLNGEKHLFFDDKEFSNGSIVVEHHTLTVHVKDANNSFILNGTEDLKDLLNSYLTENGLLDENERVIYWWTEKDGTHYEFDLDNTLQEDLSITAFILDATDSVAFSGDCEITVDEGVNVTITFNEDGTFSAEIVDVDIAPDNSILSVEEGIVYATISYDKGDSKEDGTTVGEDGKGEDGTTVTEPSEMKMPFAYLYEDGTFGFQMDGDKKLTSEYGDYTNEVADGVIVHLIYSEEGISFSQFTSGNYFRVDGVIYSQTMGSATISVDEEDKYAYVEGLEYYSYTYEPVDDLQISDLIGKWTCSEKDGEGNVVELYINVDYTGVTYDLGNGEVVVMGSILNGQLVLTSMTDGSTENVTVDLENRQLFFNGYTFKLSGQEDTHPAVGEWTLTIDGQGDINVEVTANLHFTLTLAVTDEESGKTTFYSANCSATEAEDGSLAMNSESIVGEEQAATLLKTVKYEYDMLWCYSTSMKKTTSSESTEHTVKVVVNDLSYELIFTEENGMWLPSLMSQLQQYAKIEGATFIGWYAPDDGGSFDFVEYLGKCPNTVYALCILDANKQNLPAGEYSYQNGTVVVDENGIATFDSTYSSIVTITDGAVYYVAGTEPSYYLWSDGTMTEDFDKDKQAATDYTTAFTMGEVAFSFEVKGDSYLMTYAHEEALNYIFDGESIFVDSYSVFTKYILKDGGLVWTPTFIHTYNVHYFYGETDIGTRQVEEGAAFDVNEDPGIISNMDLGENQVFLFWYTISANGNSAFTQNYVYGDTNLYAYVLTYTAVTTPADGTWTFAGGNMDSMSVVVKDGKASLSSVAPITSAEFSAVGNLAININGETDTYYLYDDNTISIGAIDKEKTLTSAAGEYTMTIDDDGTAYTYHLTVAYSGECEEQTVSVTLSADCDLDVKCFDNYAYVAEFAGSRFAMDSENKTLTQESIFSDTTTSHKTIVYVALQSDGTEYVLTLDTVDSIATLKAPDGSSVSTTYTSIDDGYNFVKIEKDDGMLATILSGDVQLTEENELYFLYDNFYYVFSPKTEGK